MWVRTLGSPFQWTLGGAAGFIRGIVPEGVPLDWFPCQSEGVNVVKCGQSLMSGCEQVLFFLSLGIQSPRMDTKGKVLPNTSSQVFFLG